MKRAFDIALSGVGLLLSSPLWVLFGLAIKLEDGGPIFYSQERVGFGGTNFDALKFRSMRTDAESRCRCRAGDRGRPARDACRPLHAQDRHGRAASALEYLSRRHELRRPARAAAGRGRGLRFRAGTLVPIDQIPGYAARTAVRPGLTGIAQIYAPRDVPRRQKFRYDRLYVRRQSMWLDLRLILLSFWISLLGTWESRGRKY